MNRRTFIATATAAAIAPALPAPVFAQGGRVTVILASQSLPAYTAEMARLLAALQLAMAANANLSIAAARLPQIAVGRANRAGVASPNLRPLRKKGAAHIAGPSKGASS